MSEAAPPLRIAMDFAGGGDGRTKALGLLLLSMADDEFVIGFSDSEWTGIGPILEEDVAISSIAQDEIGHARAFYELLAELRADGRDADSIAYDREPDEYRHCRLLDHPRGDWSDTIARRYLYDTADSVRLESLAESAYEPLRQLVAKVRREERYHVMHVAAWFERLARTPGEPRDRLTAALEKLRGDAATVFTPLDGEAVLLEARVVAVVTASSACRRSGRGPRNGRPASPCRPSLARPLACRASRTRRAS